MEFGCTMGSYRALASHLLPEVITVHNGIPTTFAIIYKGLAELLGIYCWGISTPGHFHIGVQDGEMIIIDPSDGRIVTKEEIFANNSTITDEHLIPCSNRDWLGRSLQSLLVFFAERKDWINAAAAIEMLIVIYPRAAKLVRDLATILIRADRNQAGVKLLAAYIASDEGRADPKLDELVQLYSVLET